MLNEKNERELVYIVKVEEIRPLPGYDRVEYARIGAGWWVVVKKDEFVPGKLGIYFEIDSKVPEQEPFMFLEKKKFKVKTQKMCKAVSQGLLMSPADFNWTVSEDGAVITDTERNITYKEGDFLTKRLGVVYADPEDNARKAPSVDKYKAMAQRHSKFFKKKFVRWLMRYEFGRKFLFLFFGKKKDKKTGWPAWVKKTDEERCQNMPWLFPGNGEKWYATEKIDGTSTTFTMKNDRAKELIVCSRNVVFNKPGKACFYDTNVYLEMAEKYSMDAVLKNAILVCDKWKAPVNYVTIQGETFGGTIQKRNYGSEHRLAIFNVIFGFKDGTVRRLNPVEMAVFLKMIQPKDTYNLMTVPIVDTEFTIPETCEQLLEIATGTSQIDGDPREGLVFRSKDGTQSFKAVSNEFLLKYHQ